MMRALLVPWLAVGCIGANNDDDDGVPMMGDTDDGPEPGDSVDTGMPIDLGPVTVTIDPPDGNIDVAPLVVPVVSVSRTVDTLSLTESATIAVTDSSGRTIEATPTPSGTSISFELERPLTRGDEVTFSMSGAKTSDGADIPAISATWTVHPQPLPSQFIDFDGEVAEVYAENDRGVRTGFDRYQLDDNLAFPSLNDVVVARRADTSFANGRPDLLEFFDGAGGDGTFGNADDTLAIALDVEVDGLEETTSEIDVGGDNALGTPDDSIRSRRRITYDDKYRIQQGIQATSPGADDTWFTIDDQNLQFFVVDRGDDGQITEIRVYSGAGDDELLFTDDDVVASYERRSYGTDTGLLRSIFVYTAPGPDDEWFAGGDDVIEQRELWLWSTRGQVAQRYVFTDPGPDAEWQLGSSTDDIGTLRRFTYGDDDVMSRQTVNASRGADELWNTQDDDVIGYVEFEFDTRGLWTRALWHDAPLVGELCFCNDDVFSFEVLYGPGRDTMAGSSADPVVVPEEVEPWFLATQPSSTADALVGIVPGR